MVNDRGIATFIPINDDAALRHPHRRRLARHSAAQFMGRLTVRQLSFATLAAAIAGALVVSGCSHSHTSVARPLPRTDTPASVVPDRGAPADIQAVQRVIQGYLQLSERLGTQSTPLPADLSTQVAAYVDQAELPQMVAVITGLHENTLRFKHKWVSVEPRVTAWQGILISGQQATANARVVNYYIYPDDHSEDSEPDQWQVELRRVGGRWRMHHVKIALYG